MKQRKKRVLNSVFLAMAVMIIPTVALAIQITDYREPDIFYHDAELRVLFFNLKNGNQDQTSYSGAVEAEYDMEYSTTPLKWEANVKGAMDFSRGPNDGDETADNFDIYAWTGAKKYFKEDDKLFGFGQIDLGYHDLEGSEENDPYIHLMVGAGWGRIITATPLMKAYRCIEDLKKYGIITKNVSDNGYLQLAYVINKEQEYKSKYGLRDYEMYWYEAMEEALNKEGVLKDGRLGVMGVVRIQAILQVEKPLSRYHGWEVGAGLGYLASDYAGNEHDPTLNAYFRYTLPLEFKWQIEEHLKYSTVLVDWEFSDINHMFVNTLSGNYEITDKIDWLNKWELTLIYPSNDDEDNTVKNALSSEVRFYISNTIDLSGGIRFDHLDKGDNEDDDIVTSIFFKMTYTIF